MQTPALPTQLPTPSSGPTPKATGTTPAPPPSEPGSGAEVGTLTTTTAQPATAEVNAAASMRIKIPPRRKHVKGDKVDAEAMLIEARLSQAESPPPSKPLQYTDPGGATWRPPVAAPQTLGTPIPGIPTLSDARASKPLRQDSAPPCLGQQEPPSRGSTDPPTPEEYTWPKDGFSVHGNSSTESVTILECMGEAAASGPTNLDMFVTDGLDRHGKQIIGRPQKRARTLTPPESLTEELLKRRAVTKATTDASVKYNRGGRGRNKPQAQGPPTTTAYLPHPPTPFLVVPKPGKPNDFASRIPPRPQDLDLHPIYDAKSRTRKEQEQNEANYYALATAAAFARGELSPPPPDCSAAPPRERSPFPAPEDYYDPPAEGSAETQPHEPQSPQDYPMHDLSPPPPSQPAPPVTQNHGAGHQPATSSQVQDITAADAQIKAEVGPAEHTGAMQLPGNAWAHADPPQHLPPPASLPLGPLMLGVAAYAPQPLRGPDAGISPSTGLAVPAIYAHGPEALPPFALLGGTPHVVDHITPAHVPILQVPIAAPGLPAVMAPSPARTETPPQVHGLDEMDVFASENGSEAGEIGDDELIPGTQDAPTGDTLNAQAAHITGYAPQPWDDQQIELIPEVTADVVFTPMPTNGWPTTYVSDPEDGVVGSDQARLKAWWAYPANTCMLVKVFGRAIPKDSEIDELTTKILNILKEFLKDDSIDPILVPPEAADAPYNANLQQNGAAGRQKTPLPNAWFVGNLLPAHQNACVEARVLSCREATILVYPRVSRFPRLLMAVGNFRRNDPLAILTTVKDTFGTQEVRNNIARFILGNPRRNHEPLDIAVQRIIDSISVQAYKLAEGKYVANVFCDSPAASAPSFRVWQKSLENVRFKSATASTASARPLRTCRGCHASCHPSHLCPFPAISGWNGPDTHKNAPAALAVPTPFGGNAPMGGPGPQNGPGHSRWARNGPPPPQYRNDNRNQSWTQSPRKQRVEYRWNGTQAGPSSGRNFSPRY
ncbi:hypothetical protein GSI_00952 [Ganoderma sinense ZZ0214-1]|uniref:Uncharacterized protein n=1 Tax=Ganoderma sinense ZZ0214-1 TaxID=1077348 RepID=A0A2G8SU03_9APHY|nr:hypothetical protein GSI_00952 [Ganoderma sinense ZZ0214-1]